MSRPKLGLEYFRQRIFVCMRCRNMGFVAVNMVLVMVGHQRVHQQQAERKP